MTVFLVVFETWTYAILSECWRRSPFMGHFLVLLRNDIRLQGLVGTVRNLIIIRLFYLIQMLSELRRSSLSLLFCLMHYLSFATNILERREILFDTILDQLILDYWCQGILTPLIKPIYLRKIAWYFHWIIVFLDFQLYFSILILTECLKSYYPCLTRISMKRIT